MLFDRFSRWVSQVTGHSVAFVTALAVIVVWAITGPLMGFSDAWQLVINTGTTIATFLMVFILQNAQNRDMQAIQMKLDELIRAIDNARNAIIDLEDTPEEDIRRLKADFAVLAESARHTGEPAAQNDHSRISRRRRRKAASATAETERA